MKIVLEGRVAYEVEDQGAALAAHVGDEVPAGQEAAGHVWVVIRSWDERMWDEESRAAAHPEARALEGKRVRVTIETVEDSNAQILERGLEKIRGA